MWKLTIEDIDDQPTLIFPEEVLKELGVGEGDELELEATLDGMLLRTPSRREPTGQ